MRLAANLLWHAAGNPGPRRGVHRAVGCCYWCAVAIDGDACDVDDVITDSFTDQDQAFARSSPLLCVACAWSMTGRPPDTLRMWSLAYREDGVPMPAHHEACSVIPPLANVTAQNKADPSVFRSMLRTPPEGQWFVSIADTGQVHVLPFCEANRGGGRWSVRFERTTIRSTPEEYRRIDDAFGALMAAGFSKGEIESGSPYISRLAANTEAWSTHAPTIYPYLNSGLLGLVSFLIRKEKMVHDEGTDVQVVGGAPREGDDALGEPAGHPADPVVGASDNGAQNGRRTGHGQGLLFGTDF